jgi:hypothetical protein
MYSNLWALNGEESSYFWGFVCPSIITRGLMIGFVMPDKGMGLQSRPIRSDSSNDEFIATPTG